MHKLIGSMYSEDELRRCMNEVRAHFPNVSNSSAFVALAESEGSVEEACAKLSDEWFLQESKLISRVADINTIIRERKYDEDGGVFDVDVGVGGDASVLEVRVCVKGERCDEEFLFCSNITTNPSPSSRTPLTPSAC